MYSLVYRAEALFPSCRAVLRSEIDQLITVRRCVICFRPAKIDRIVEVSLQDTPLLDHVQGHNATDIIAQILFAEHAPIHGRCLPIWDTLQFHQYRKFTTWEYQWETHCREYVPRYIHWYKELVQCIETRNARALVHWPLPSAGRKPRPREAVGQMFHKCIQQHWHCRGFRHPVSPAFQINISLAKVTSSEWVKVTSPECISPQRCPFKPTEENIKFAFPHIHINDIELFSPEGMSIAVKC